MSNMTRICFVRHGETDWNVELRMQGHVDIPLNAKGLAQADALGRSFAEGMRADALYSSDLLRARQTAQPLADALARAMDGDDRRLVAPAEPGLLERPPGEGGPGRDHGLVEPAVDHRARGREVALLRRGEPAHLLEVEDAGHVSREREPVAGGEDLVRSHG